MAHWAKMGYYFPVFCSKSGRVLSIDETFFISESVQ